MKQTVKQHLSDCDRDLRNAAKIIQKDPISQTAKYLTLYALVRTSGAVEYAYKSIIADYFEKSKIPQVKNYLDKMVRKSYNSAKYSQIAGMLGNFDDNWNKAFKSQLNARPDGKKIISSIDSLVDCRHAFAHGNPTTVSFDSINAYYKDAKELLVELDSVLN